MVINFNKGGGGGGGTTYTAGENIDITNNVISCTIDTGATVDAAVSVATAYTDTASAATYDASTAYTDSRSAATYGASTAYTRNAVSDAIDLCVQIQRDGSTSEVGLIWAGTQAEYEQISGYTAPSTLFIVF